MCQNPTRWIRLTSCSSSQWMKRGECPESLWSRYHGEPHKEWVYERWPCYISEVMFYDKTRVLLILLQSQHLKVTEISRQGERSCVKLLNVSWNANESQDERFSISGFSPPHWEWSRSHPAEWLYTAWSSPSSLLLKETWTDDWWTTCGTPGPPPAAAEKKLVTSQQWAE